MTPRQGRYFTAGAIIVVVAAIGFGIRIMGPPSEARQIRIDAQRVDHLTQISHAVDRYYLQHKQMPGTLESLQQVSAVRLADPVTGQPFEYRVDGAKHYELCAVFSGESVPQSFPDFWWHAAGRQCYGLAVRELSINRQIP